MKENTFFVKKFRINIKFNDDVNEIESKSSREFLKRSSARETRDFKVLLVKLNFKIIVSLLYVREI